VSNEQISNMAKLVDRKGPEKEDEMEMDEEAEYEET
jgi:hypothetical protein